MTEMNHRFEPPLTPGDGEPGEPSAPPPSRGTRLYYWIFAWLMLLLILTVIASWVPFDHLFPGLNAIVAFTIAGIKAILVVLFFMHVRHASKMTWAFSAAGLLWLGIMISLTFGDYLSRAALPGSLTATPSEQWPYPLEHVNRWIESPVSGRTHWAEPLGSGHIEGPSEAPITPPPPATQPSPG